MVAQSSKISRTSYNDIVTKISEILGTGSGQKGYGQVLNVTPISLVDKVKVRQPQWAALRIDILRISAHQGVLQNGSWTPGTLTSIPTLPSIVTGTKISASHVNAFDNAITVLNNTINLYKLAQFSDEQLVQSTRTNTWNTSIKHSFTIDFGTANNARYFFNAGGTIRIIPTFVKSVSDPINNDWETLVNGVGTVIFNYSSTASSAGLGIGSSIGFYGLTTNQQQIYTKTGSFYSQNDYTITAACDVVGSPRYIYFEVKFNDDKLANPNIDEVVQGTLTNEVRMFRPTEPSPGAGVVVIPPAAITTIPL